MRKIRLRRTIRLTLAALVAWRLAAVAWRGKGQPLRQQGEAWDWHAAWHTVRGCPVFSRHAGPAQAPAALPLVLVHGLGVSGTYFLPLAERLARHHPLHVPDLPGHGRSATPGRAMDIGELAQALLDWMEGAGVRHAVLVGHSMGAQIAIEAIGRQPQQFAALILIGPMHDPKAGPVRPLGRLLRTAPFEHLSLFGILARDYLRMGWRLLPEYLAMLRDPVARKLDRLRLPVMLIKGERDALVPDSWFGYLRQSTRAGHAIVIRGKGHAVHLSAPAQVAAEIGSFLSHLQEGGGEKSEEGKTERRER